MKQWLIFPNQGVREGVPKSSCTRLPGGLHGSPPHGPSSYHGVISFSETLGQYSKSRTIRAFEGRGTRPHPHPIRCILLVNIQPTLLRGREITSWCHKEHSHITKATKARVDWSGRPCRRWLHLPALWLDCFH